MKKAIKKGMMQNPARVLEIVHTDGTVTVQVNKNVPPLIERTKVKGIVTIEVKRKNGQIERQRAPVYKRIFNSEEYQQVENLFTNSGRDFGHAQVYTNTSAGTIGANYIGVTTDSTTPSASDTALASEATTNGMARAQATTITHTTGTNVSTLAKTFTATGTVTALAKAALFNAAGPPVNGTMVHEALFAATVTLQSGDSVTVTWTITYG